MAVSIETCTIIKVEGSKGAWKVPRDLLVNVDDATYVRLPPSTTSLVRMLCEMSSSAPKPTPKNFSLTASCGYKSLVRLRNDAQQRELAEEQQPMASRRLFDVAPPTTNKRKRVSRTDIRGMREQPQTLSIDVPSCNGGDAIPVSVLRPVHPKDCLAVLLDTTDMGAVFAYIGHCEFEQTEYYKQDRSLPKGIWKRSNGYLVAHEVDGQTRYKLLPNTADDALDNAIAFKANPSLFDTDVDDGDNGAVDDEAHVGGIDDGGAEA